ncbi:MAG TPA: hypothetical protein DCQ98_19955 [Planctomycetaceae bacterium]|nr:hypothetical protein [Planctomycetaceae bacterium]
MNPAESRPEDERPFRRLQRFERHLHGATQGHFDRDEQADDPWTDWLAVSFGLPHIDRLPPVELPAATRLNWLGWNAYHRDDPVTAATALSESWPIADEPIDRISAALGLGKLATGLGRWHTARNWTITALRLARRADRLYDVVRGYGALGEILLRGGREAEALVAFGAARRLLPAGGGERPRQLTYLATALSRSEDRWARDEAESLLMVALRLAIDADDPVGVRHALARLQMLEMRRGGAADIADRCGLEPARQRYREREIVGERTESAAKLAGGLLQLARAFAAFRRGELSLAIALASESHAGFADRSAERRWARLVLAAGDGHAPPPFAPHEVPLLAPPAPIIAIADAPFGRVPLDEDGFAALREQRADLDHAWSCRSAFFL